MTRRNFSLSALALVLAIVTTGTAQARSRHDDPEVRAVDIQFTDPGLLTGVQNVRCGSQQPGVCELEFRGHSTVTGTMTGFTDYTMWAHGNTDGSKSYYTLETFTGAVDGCGRGTFGFVTEDGVVGATPSATDPLGNDIHATWTVVPDSGTGDLTRLVSGGGEQHGVTYPDTSTHGQMTGTITCASSG